MNRFEFMKQLEALLHEVSQSEREEALQYYNDYFDDAGEENEKDVIAALGSPAKVAEIIKGGISGKNDDKYEFTDSGFQNGTERKGNALALRNEQTEEKTYHKAAEKKNISPVTIILAIVGGIFVLPIFLPLVVAMFAVFIALLIAAIAIVFSVALVGIAILISGVILFIVGMFKLFIAPFAALCLAGVGMVLAGLGILFLLATTWLFSKAIPAVVRGIVSICRLPFKRKEGQTV